MKIEEKKVTMLVNCATYPEVLLTKSTSPLINNKKNTPIKGIKIVNVKIGMSLILINKLVILLILLRLQKHNDTNNLIETIPRVQRCF